jgi:histidine triad (HIT) family protein
MNQNEIRDRGRHETCIFCQILAGSLPSRKIIENDRCLAFLDIAPASKGHTLIVPKTHSEDIFDIDPAVLSDVMAMTQAVAKVLEKQLRPDGMSLFQMNRVVGWQTVFHFHMHVIPRWSGDALVEPWIEKLAQEVDLEMTYGEIIGESVK